MHSRELLLKVLNGVLFNIAWLCCVLGGNQLAVATAAVFLAAHFLIVTDSYAELLLIALIAAAGIAIDMLWFVFGVLVNADGSDLVPLWLCALWLCFATTLSHCFSFLQERLKLAAVVGGLAGAINYLAGVRLSDVELGVSMPLAFVLLLALWALLFPALLFAARTFAGRELLARSADRDAV